jgi:hypothetical protein
MVKKVVHISSRRSYEFRQDDIRLSLLSSEPVVQHIKTKFAFNFGAVATPAETFGPIAPSLPPGLVFNYGVTPYPEGDATPIRFIHIEARRIVIDVVGRSEVLKSTYDDLCGELLELIASDGSRAIGTPTYTRDHSDFRVELDFDPAELLAEGFATLMSEAFGYPEGGQNSQLVVPSLRVRFPFSGYEYAADSTPAIDSYIFDIRAGTDPVERQYVSSAPLDSEAHIGLLERIEKSIVGERHKPVRKKRSRPSSKLETHTNSDE